jgi:NADH:ubiquinone oxidoreductase subunit E
LLGKIRRRNSSSLLAKVADRRKYIIPRLKNIQKFNGYDEKQTNNVVSDYGIQKQQELEKFIKRDD